ncbi:FxLD family lanthipeptide [Frankia sp. Cpl3]|nr:FxLD family lanthipeptide [Frankia sp. Cpl3]
MDEYELNIDLVDAGPVSGHASNTDDSCGTTGSDSCAGG